jgi:hypothetical protein
MQRNFGFTFGRTPEGRDRDYAELEKRLAEEKTISPDSYSPPLNVTSDDNPPQDSLTPGWLYVPGIGMEFSPVLEGLNSNWYDAHRLVKSKNFVMPSPDETWALFFEAKAQIAKPEFRKIYEFFTQKTPVNTWHGEWQDAYFKVENGKIYMHKLKGFNSKKEPEFHQGVDITGTYLTKDCYANISQKANLTSFGLCKVEDSQNNYVVGENMHFWFPRNGSVARFGANSDRAFLNCDRAPTSANPSLGVRLARRVAPSILQKNQGGSS